MTSTLGQIDPTKVVDHYDLDDGDANFPINVPYVVPAQMKGLIRATLSWYRMPFRATSQLSPSSITNTALASDASGSSGHSHSHAHTIPISNIGVGGAVSFNGAGTNLSSGTVGNTAAINSDASGESGHSHSHNHGGGGHSHSLTGSSALAVTEGGVATVAAVAFDGADQTGPLGGPWSGDVVELDVSSLISLAPGFWHLIALSLSGQGRLTTLLRFYYTT